MIFPQTLQQAHRTGGVAIAICEVGIDLYFGFDHPTPAEISADLKPSRQGVALQWISAAATRALVSPPPNRLIRSPSSSAESTRAPCKPQPLERSLWVSDPHDCRLTMILCCLTMWHGNPLIGKRPSIITTTPCRHSRLSTLGSLAPPRVSVAISARTSTPSCMFADSLAEVISLRTGFHRPSGTKQNASTVSYLCMYSEYLKSSSAAEPKTSRGKSICAQNAAFPQ